VKLKHEEAKRLRLILPKTLPFDIDGAVELRISEG